MSACSILENAMTRLGPKRTGCCVRSIPYQRQVVRTQTTISPEKLQIQDKVKEHRRPDIEKKRESVRLLILLFLVTKIKPSKNRKKLTSTRYRITESLECQGIGHTSSSRCSRNYVEENTSLYSKTDCHPDRHGKQLS